MCTRILLYIEASFYFVWNDQVHIVFKKLYEPPLLCHLKIISVIIETAVGIRQTVEMKVSNERFGLHMGQAARCVRCFTDWLKVPMLHSVISDAHTFWEVLF